jgi:hypothetical protein
LLLQDRDGLVERANAPCFFLIGLASGQPLRLARKPAVAAPSLVNNGMHRVVAWPNAPLVDFGRRLIETIDLPLKRQGHRIWLCRDNARRDRRDGEGGGAGEKTERGSTGEEATGGQSDLGE